MNLLPAEAKKHIALSFSLLRHPFVTCRQLTTLPPSNWYIFFMIVCVAYVTLLLLGLLASFLQDPVFNIAFLFIETIAFYYGIALFFLIYLVWMFLCMVVTKSLQLFEAKVSFSTLNTGLLHFVLLESYAIAMLSVLCMLFISTTNDWINPIYDCILKLLIIAKVVFLGWLCVLAVYYIKQLSQLTYVKTLLAVGLALVVIRFIVYYLFTILV